MNSTVPMSHEDLTDFIIGYLKKGKLQEEIRQETYRYAVSDTEFDAALLEALTGKYMHETANLKIVDPATLIIIGLLLLASGILFITLLDGRLIPVLGSIMIIVSGIFLVGARRISNITI